MTIEIAEAKISNALICRPKRSSGVSSIPKSSWCTSEPNKRLREPLDDEAEAQRRHEQRVRASVDQRTQHEPFDQHRADDHHENSYWKRGPERQSVLVQHDERQRREEDHRPLGEVEDARGLVDQHEADRDHAVHQPGQESGDQNIKEEHRAASVLHAEIGGDDLGIAPDLLGRAVADFLAVVEHHDMVREAHDHANVVLDQHDRRPQGSD